MSNIYNTKVGFDVPAEHIPTEQDLQRYAEGDESVINPLIEGLTSSIISSVNWFLSHSVTAQPYAEDCVSEALFSLTKFVNRNVGKTYGGKHFQNAAKLACLSSVRNWLREMSITVTLPARSGRRNSISLVRRKLNDHKAISNGEVFDKVWFDQFLQMLDSFDRKLVELRIAGYTDRRIGREVGMSHTHVKNHLVRLGNFYLNGE